MRTSAWMVRSLGFGLALAAPLIGGTLLLADEKGQWTDGELVAAYTELRARGDLEAAVRAPKLPDEEPEAAFLEALAWFAAGTPETAGTLTLDQLDRFVDGQVNWYMQLLRAQVEEGFETDYPRTRTWKVIQKLALLRRAMVAPGGGGTYAYPSISRVPVGDDPWETAHTVRSVQDFQERVCRGSHERPVLVKYGNTNCTQCMLFELMGSVKEFAQRPENKRAFDVYKLWWGFEPDDSFAGVVRNPARLDAIAQAEGVSSSPYFIAYRNGRSFPCGSAFPDDSGEEERLEACIRQVASGEGRPTKVCGSTGGASS